MKKIAIIGAGFTGLASAYYLSQNKNFEIHIFEKEKKPGGLAGGFKSEDWQNYLEFHYHHFFTNDKNGLNLMQDVNFLYQTFSPETAIYTNKKIYRFDGPISLIKFPLLSFFEKIRVGITLFSLKMMPQTSLLAKKTAFDFFEKTLGKKSFQILFKPLLTGKFGEYAEKISALWFWARIKKRTKKLIYPEDGYQKFAEKLLSEIKRQGVIANFNFEIEKIEKIKDKWRIINRDNTNEFDNVIFTLPSSVFKKLLPVDLQKPLENFFDVKHLNALNLILETTKPILAKTYWLNINEKNFPFLALVQHTNFIDKKNYNGNHICYIGNYLPKNHEYFSFSKEKLLEFFLPFIREINPKFEKNQIINLYKIVGQDAQPIVTLGYEKLLPPINLGELDTNLNGLYLANMDMVYPWDRGVNYAIEMGEKVTKIINV